MYIIIHTNIELQHLLLCDDSPSIVQESHTNVMLFVTPTLKCTGIDNQAERAHKSAKFGTC